MKYFIEKHIPKQALKLKSAGGNFTKASDKVMQIIGWITSGEKEPLKGIPITNHGETRIRHCIKYDLPGYCRLVTVQNNNLCILLYVGSHDEVDKWLNANKGYEMALDPKDGFLKKTYVTLDLEDEELRISPKPDYSEGFLYEKLSDRLFDSLTDGISRSIIRKIEDFESTTPEDEILILCQKVQDSNQGEALFDVLMSLRSAQIDEAKNRIYLYKNDLQLIEDVKSEEILTLIKSNDQFIDLDSFDEDTMRILLKNTSWQDWMLFMHPKQKEIVENDYQGPVRLLGVSGSGKTCVVVKRAIRLAKKYKKEKILILTLNNSLSKLIDKLLQTIALNDDELNSILSEQIIVKNFWELCKEMLLKFEPESYKLYRNVTYKNREDIDEIWNEYYTCDYNVADAEVMFPIHRTLLSRNIDPFVYIRQEFDWIRSAFFPDNKQNYLNAEREGRMIPIEESQRELILKGLEGWEEKMPAVGAFDYIGLIKPLSKYIERILAEYRCVLVDEMQDFGTVELNIVRRLVNPAENDLFLCGDTVQRVYAKHHKITLAGIKPVQYLEIRKNYRNSREILEAAYNVLKNNVNDSNFNDDNFKVINPEYANFSTAKPLLIKSNSLENELLYSISYLKETLSEVEKGCIALCGYSYYDICRIAQQLDIPVLDGDTDLDSGNLFLSDLELTKGFEFDRMIIVNCSKSEFPNRNLPAEELYREVSKLYVVMTRAKKELFVSYSREYSSLFENSLQYFNEIDWSKHIQADSLTVPTLDLVRTSSNIQKQALAITGKKFLYKKQAIGTSQELQEKILNLVRGSSVQMGRDTEEWATMESLRLELSNGRTIPQMTKKFGPKTIVELRNLLQVELPTAIRQ